MGEAMSSEVEAVALEDVRRIAELANLKLTPEEEPRMRRDLNAILGHISQLNELDTTDVPAMAQVGEMMDGVRSEWGGGLRSDEERGSLKRGEVLCEAAEADARFFKVPKVIER